MNLNKSTRYALYAAMEMAAAGEEGQVTVARVAERYNIPGSVLAKVFQRLVRSGIALGTRGTGGGYSLARSPSKVTMLDVIDAFESGSQDGDVLLAEEADPGIVDPGWGRLKQVFDEVTENARCTFASISLETLVNRRSNGANGDRL